MFVRHVIAIALLPASFASAQVIYEPTRIQYGGSQPYFYAGVDPRIHQAAAFPNAPGVSWGRCGGYAFANDRRAVVQRFARTYTDAFGVRDARPFGLTIDHVQNEANARVPRYFRKADLVAVVKPAVSSRPPAERTGTIIIRPSPRRMSR